jgi:hypothetical protein
VEDIHQDMAVGRTAFQKQPLKKQEKKINQILKRQVICVKETV